MRPLKRPLSGWGGYPTSCGSLFRPERSFELNLASAALIARGLGRSYGDGALNHTRDILLTERLNRMLHFDGERGLLTAESGVTLEEILDLFVPRGWFLPVVPGTKFVTIGGAVAADIHGKNHHRDGTFSSAVQSLTLLLADGTVKELSREKEPNLFWATVGGMGLTGIIKEVTLALKRVETAYMQVKYHPAPNIDAALNLLSNQTLDDHYSVAWIDCLQRGANCGRSIVITGHHAKTSAMPKGIEVHKEKKKRHTLPFYLPSFALNRWSIKAFNAAYYAYHKNKAGKEEIVHYDSFFFPLDAINHWNRLYGKRGFIQYQCVTPEKQVVKTLLERLSNSQRGSFLAVLKRFGPGNKAPLSFPIEGYTLALDIPLKDEGLFPLLDSLDEIVVKSGGRCYLAKDARMSPAAFRKMYPQLEAFLHIKKQVDPKGKFQSDLSRRLQMGT